MKSAVAIPVIGVIEPGADAAAAISTSREALVFATEATCASHAYQRALARRGFATHEKACPLLVPLVEEGWLDTPSPSRWRASTPSRPCAMHRQMSMYWCSAAPTIPLLRPLLRRVVPQRIQIVDSAEATARALLHHLDGHDLAAGEPGYKFFVTDSVEKFRKQAPALPRLCRPAMSERADLDATLATSRRADRRAVDHTGNRACKASWARLSRRPFNITGNRCRNQQVRPYAPAASKETKMIFRSDNRALDQMRALTLTPEFIRTAEGSCLIEVGNTRVICTATIEESVPGWMRNQGKGWVTSEYGMLPRATLTRTAREAAKGKQGGRTHEIQRLIGRSMRAIVDMAKLGERTLWIDCDVIQADGGTRTASITGGFVAMALAMQKLVACGTLKQLPLKDTVAAISVGIVDGEPMLDLAYEEDSRAAGGHELRAHRRQQVH